VETVAQQRQHRVGVGQVGHVLAFSWPKPPSSVLASAGCSGGTSSL
jgi:hypothetical protein